MQYYTSHITAGNLRGLILSLAHSLRNNTDHVEKASKKLYDQLIAPLQPALQQHQIQTLVWVPDGILRLISPAALFDGKQYLIEQYAIATSPGLTLLDAVPMQEDGMRVLLAGMSVPGPVLEQLPTAWANDLAETSARGLNLGKPKSRALPNVHLEMNTAAKECQPKQRAALTAVSRATRQQALKTILSLPGVEQEMHSLQQDVPNTLLLNETFTVGNFKQQLLQRKRVALPSIPDFQVVL